MLIVWTLDTIINSYFVLFYFYIIYQLMVRASIRSILSIQAYLKLHVYWCHCLQCNVVSVIPPHPPQVFDLHYCHEEMLRQANVATAVAMRQQAAVQGVSVCLCLSAALCMSVCMSVCLSLIHTYIVLQFWIEL